MNELRIAFRGTSVVLRSDAAEVMTAFGRRFQNLDDGHRSTPVATLEVAHGAVGGYRCRDNAGDSHDARSLDGAVRWATYQALEHLILARGDLIWFHGAAVGAGGRAVVLPGRRGRGKSTLSRALWERGASFLTDDVLPIDPSTRQVLPFPQLPAVRTDPGKDLDDAALAHVPKEEVDVNVRVERSALPIGALVLPAYQRGAVTRLLPCSPGEAALALLEGCWNLELHREAAAGCVASITPGLPACRLQFSEPESATGALWEWISDRL